MNKKIEQHLKDYGEKMGLTFDDTDADYILEILQNATIVKRTLEDIRWWYDIYTYIVLIDGMYISYVYGRTTGDASPEDMDYILDFSSIFEVNPVKKMVEVTEYVGV